MPELRSEDAERLCADIGEGDGTMGRLIDAETLMKIGIILAIIAFIVVLLGFLLFAIGYFMEIL